MSEKYSSQSIIPIQIKNSTQSMNSALTKNTCLTQKCFSAQAQALLEEKKESPPKKKLKQNHALNCVMLFLQNESCPKYILLRAYFPIQIKYSTQSINSALTKNTCLTQRCFSGQTQVCLKKQKEKKQTLSSEF